MVETPDRKPSDRTTGQPKDETGLLDVLKLLIESRKAKTTADLVKYASQYGAAESTERLKLLDAEGIPMDLAFDFVAVHLRVLAHKRNSSLLASCKDKKVGLVLPIAPHLVDLFTPIADVTFLQPEEAHHHGPPMPAGVETIRGARACRAKAQEMDVLVFETWRDGGKLFVESAVGDALEPKLLPSSLRLIAHLRPHGRPGDVPFEPLTSVSFI
jgi:hypothetical protein